MRTALAIALAGLTVGCSGGALFLESAATTSSPIPCEGSTVCGAGFVCDVAAGTCIESDGRCSAPIPDGDCPLGRECEQGVCVSTGGGGGGFLECSDCDAAQVCHLGECITATGPQACSAQNLDGYCPDRGVCVAGACVPIVPGTNDCSVDRPRGLCPPGATCAQGFCVPIDDSPCSEDVPGGACPAGQACDGVECQVAFCSGGEPFGFCANELICLEGVCEDPAVFLDCGDFDCAAINRGTCTEVEGVPTCGACAVGYDEDALGNCTPQSCLELNCLGANQVCDTSGGGAVCGDCLDNYRDEGTNCVAQTCSDIDCANEFRECDSSGAPALCGNCVPGYFEGPSGCEPATCDDLNCAAENRSCSESGSFASCSECLPDFIESDGQCIQCDETADCAAGYCHPETRVCTVDCEPSSGSGCGDGFVCTPFARCAATAPAGDVCGAGIAEGDIEEPIVMLLVDRSGSMGGQPSYRFCMERNPAGDCIRDPYRWFAVEEVLFGAGTPSNDVAVNDAAEKGLVTQLEDQIRFGMVMYSKVDGNSECPMLRSPDFVTSPTLNARDTLASYYAERSWIGSGDTPTGESIDEVADFLVDLRAAGETAAMYIVLATDGEPDDCTCVNPNPTSRAEWRVIDAANRAYQSYGITTYALSVGSDTSREHLQDVANAGAGFPLLRSLDFDDYSGCVGGDLSCYGNRQTECVADEFFNGYVATYGHACLSSGFGEDLAPCFVASDGDALVSSLGQIFTEVLSCTIQVNAFDPINDGVVWLDGDQLPRGDDGWEVRGPFQIELVGAACDKVKDGNEHFVSVEITTCAIGG